MSDSKRFKTKYKINPNTDCWEWISYTDKDGYGLFDRKVNGIWKKFRAPRVAYEFAYGRFNTKLQVLHQCDNPCCVNPKHLFIGTRSDNMKDMHQKNRGRHKYSKLQILNIRKLSFTGISNINLSKKYKCSAGLISAIITKRAYKWVK